MPKSRRHRRGGATRRRRRGGASRKARGGNVNIGIGGVVSALKTALPSIVLYEALRMQGKRTNRKRAGRTRRGGRKRRRRR